MNYLERVIASQWRFEHATVTSSGFGHNTVTSGRSVGRTSTPAGGPQGNVQPGQSVLQIGSSRNDLSIVWGNSPWIVG